MTETAENRLIVEGLGKSYSGPSEARTVFAGLSFTLECQQTLVILGPSGSGKSTLLNLVGALDRPDAGRITLGGTEVGVLEGEAAAKYRNRKVGFVFQDHHLLPQCTALENVLLPALAHPDPDRPARRGMELLERVGLADRAEAFPAELSGGERQRVALARALFNEPALILADEPTGNLDRKNGALLLELFHKANETYGQTIMVATHDAQISGGMNRTLQLEDGVLVDTPA